MSSYTFDVPVIRKTEVLVVGGGCAGIAAAVCAARHGAKVLLAENNNCLGGMATSGLIGPFMTSYDPAGERQVIVGFYDEFVRRMMARGGAIHPSECRAGDAGAGYRIAGHDHCGPFEAEAFKAVAEDMCTEAGVELLYGALFQRAVMNEDGTRVTGAVFATKAGLIEIDAEQVIDCTGDADVAASAGAPFLYGDEQGVAQPSSLFFIIRGVDKARMERIREETGDPTSIYFHKAVEKEREAGRYHVPREKVAIYECPDGTFRVNMSRVQLKNACDPFEVTQATVAARRQIDEIVAMLKRIVPGCENIEVTTSASMLGHRETRRIQGDFVLTGDDLRAGRRFEDDIFLAGNSIDMHGGKSVNYQPAKGDAYGVPYRILLPRKVQNLMVAGRASSMDRGALAAIRVMPPVFAMGQAAGTAAALCISKGTDPALVDTKELQKLLLEDGVVLE